MAGKTNHTKADIIALTIREIKENGAASISLRKLLAKLHLTTGSFYKHFDNKDDLFRTVTAILSERISQLTRQATNGNTQKTPLIRLVDLGEFIIMQFQQQPNLMTFLFFNHSIQKLYRNGAIDQFPLLIDTRKLIEIIINTYPTNDSEDTLFIKVWAFIQGYAILIQSGVVQYNRNLLLTTAKQMIGDNLK